LLSTVAPILPSMMACSAERVPSMETPSTSCPGRRPRASSAAMAPIAISSLWA
jgi:hypothetical protein